MTFAHTMIGICWFLVVVIWLVTGAQTKKPSKDRRGRTGRWIRFILFICFIACLWVKELSTLNDVHMLSPTYFTAMLSATLCMVGVGFAIWARLCIGRNWGMPMTVIEQTQLVTSGPYSLVRHPIYSGLCLALLGSLLTAGLIWGIWYFAWALYFVYSAVKEEKLMLVRFPNEYPLYQEKTKMLIPFVL
jgi:protein-S-isoprenylcysteine O-methyltransferase Ste14